MKILITKENLNELNNIKQNESFYAFCNNCGIRYEINSFRKERIERYKILLCQPCYAKYQKELKYGNPNYNNREKAKETSLSIYGSEYPTQNKKVIDKIKETNLKLYGGSGASSKIIKAKINKTNLERYGVEEIFASKEIKEKSIKTMNERYGVSYTAESPELRKKMEKTSLERYGCLCFTNRDQYKETCIEKYGVDNVFKVSEVRERIKETNKERYGGVAPIYDNDVKEKIIKTCLNRYGVENYSKTPDFIHKIESTNISKYGKAYWSQTDYRMYDELYNPDKYSDNKILYNGYSFDSIPELCIYIYCTDYCIPIIRNPKICFRYFDIDGNPHSTYPDFMIDGLLYEIKGGKFYKEDGTWKYPYNTKVSKGKLIKLSPEEKYKKDFAIESKRKCLLSNGVIILQDNLNPWVLMCCEYVKSKYTSSYIDLFIKKSYSTNPNSLYYGWTPYNSKNDGNKYADFIGIGKTPFNIDTSRNKYYV